MDDWRSRARATGPLPGRGSRLDHVEQQLGGGGAPPEWVGTHGGQGWVEVARELGVVEPGHGQLAGHRHSA